MQDIPGHALGYLASGLVFATFYMRTMVPLRCVAIASNVAFLVYGLWLGAWPIAILHSALLPLNVMRLFQIHRMLAQIHRARTGDIDFHALTRSFRATRYPRGTVLFRKGDPGESAYYIANGEVDFPEIQTRCGVGELFGEIAIFSPGGVRTASAVCAGDVELYEIDEHAIRVAFHQSPAFAFSLLRLVTARLLDNYARLEKDLPRSARNEVAAPQIAQSLLR